MRSEPTVWRVVLNTPREATRQGRTHVNDGVIGSTGPVQVRAQGLVLREWHERDVPFMVAMFDTAEMDRWTPLAHPFDEEAARAYLEGAHRRRAEGGLQLAITVDGDEPLGEVLLFPTDIDAACELGYSVGARHRGRGLATRAVRAMLPVARAEGYRVARLRIAVDNVASQRVARAAGFALTAEPLLRQERKGYVVHLATWASAIP
jgi:RimJ/RimL family protein N-acetyltransferase